MRREEVLKNIKEAGVVAVVRGDSKEEALKIVDAVSKGGIKVMELTMTVPNPVEVIKEVAEKYKDTDVIVGAGTVLDSETARACILAGAQFIVSPSLDIDTLKLCNRYKILVMPGVMTVKDAITAFEYGVDVVKIFPANLYGPSVIKSFKGPLPQGDFMPTGGVSIANLHEWIEAGAFVVGTGGDLTKGAKTGDYDLVQRTAKEFMDAYRKAKERI
ncbi:MULTISPECIES: bifunctional 4-hydroxy-2-oxoglutarate aldolase/2-dehydro-3-deoxy-phosphogluconate aldolase [Clostridium]|jgi:2-keto-3-deoxy-phosphogluconate aldolase (EC 4.1.2.14)|uniref:2-dehydro-3-deoxyphosphogluconate aldolase/(4S)-4-hydroxy-2-oxoglutarate aldolase n=3 Tax=Clostridium beijerinckii TaxID=1520 RepID=A0A1B9BQR6_CLOBE|nr:MULTISPECIES: bifunctional 4-hydroxy-2-oxoglutarate aldolase/2-dehydro-3-deoxy-phosphogluconate aldolase [Clostridium]ABR34007.1 response regulator receiver protein [Clostridium beijerinckii NCIMB 8052]AIU00571.1 keto-hydroxyglutarate-aldolase/keto-deoxy- phosphogluconate aldolase [Clostridium beijerinckii ATCC 35702]ALB46938.1 bifunctional 4-hydroxy-2-oxoglutarate aldolase/2-dehydro-3-deoxy-phosphogluconate aldolase [Clostridium beijerinckii NRRL B-598]AQS04456.1 KHG/KDPG aldolase [Clostrid